MGLATLNVAVERGTNNAESGPGETVTWSGLSTSALLGDLI